MKKGLGIVFLLAAAIAALAISQASAVCDPGMKDVCYNNFPLSSNLGFGAAEICSVCYPCGAQDGVCPEDFQDITGFVANCTGCNDPDCNATIFGSVVKFDNQVPIEHAQVKGVPTNPHMTGWENTTFTDQQGNYRLEVPSGRIVASASAIGLDTEVKEVILHSREVLEVNFALPNASCDENCTNYFERCNRDCQGINGCSYADYQDGYSRIADLCHERRFGEWVVLNQSGDDTTSVQCCSGYNVANEKTPPLRIEGKMKNLITTEIPALYGGRPVQLVIAVWY